MGDRDDIDKLVALAYQIAEKISLAKEGMEEILGLRNDQEPLKVLRDRLSKISLEDRLSKLLSNESIMNANPSADLLVIDGLDECSSREGICRLIDWIRKNELPFRFLLTSRLARTMMFEFFVLQSRKPILENISSNNLRNSSRYNSASRNMGRQSGLQNGTSTRRDWWRNQKVCSCMQPRLYGTST